MNLDDREMNLDDREMKFVVLSFGSNGSGQLAIGHKEDVSTPTPCTFPSGIGVPSRPVQLAAGGNHTLLRCEDGAVYAAGLNTDGRCGLVARNESFTTFERVAFAESSGEVIDSFKLVAATWEASIFVTSEDKVYTCGSGARGELGFGPIQRQPRPSELLIEVPLTRARPQIIDIAACMGHVAIVCSTGEVVGWGGSRKGQLGVLDNSPRLPGHVSVRSREAIAHISYPSYRVLCGQEFTCIFKPPDVGNVETCGSDKHHIQSSAPHVPLPPWRQVAASWGSVFVLLDDGKLMRWGRNDHGQLGPSNLPQLVSITAGSEHCLAETEEGKIIAWGWGEHGNCGPSTDARADVKGIWNEIGSGHLLGAGCATSWIYLEGES